MKSNNGNEDSCVADKDESSWSPSVGNANTLGAKQEKNVVVVATNSATDKNSTKAQEQSQLLRVLKRGDLVRVAESKQSGEDRGLGRILRVHTIETSNSRPLYDVEFVLGGRLLGLDRTSLVHTTADAEGFTQESSRQRRNTSQQQEKVDSTTTQNTNSQANGQNTKDTTAADGTKKAKYSKKATKKNAPAKKKQEVKEKVVRSKAKATKTKTQNKSSTAKKRKGGTVKNKPQNKRKRNAVEEAAPTTTSTSTAMDLYERQCREFERLVNRLERLDPFGFFLGPPLEGHEEVYDGQNTTKREDAIAGENNGVKETSMDETNHDKQVTETKPRGGISAESVPDIQFPSAAPFNWEVIRQRMKHGRYVLDFVKEKAKDCSNASHGQFLHSKGVHWDLFQQDVVGMCSAAIERDPSGGTGGTGTLGHSANKIKDAMEQMYERTGRRHMNEMSLANARHKYTMALNSSDNNEAAFQGDWRQYAFRERKYERLHENVVCAGLSDLDQRSAIYELQTSIPDSFVGLSYKFDDIGQSERWMKTVIDDTGGRNKRSRRKRDELEEQQRAAAALAADNGVIRAQVQAAMQTMLITVQDRVMTDKGVLNDPELRSANWETPGAENENEIPGTMEGFIPVVEAMSQTCSDTGIAKVCREIHDENPTGCELVEQPVWGLDCYTRRNITMCLETEFTPEIAFDFVEKWLLPAINACPVDLAHNLSSAARLLEGIPLEDNATNNEIMGKDNVPVLNRRWSHSLLGKALLDKIRTSGPPWLEAAARVLRLAHEAMGADFFRVHPKGHGSVVLRREGVAANTLVTFYRGEVYPPWRWSEKMDAIDMTQTSLALRPNLPDFYNMALERPQVDPRGYGLLFVDASRKAGHGSSLSHSCEPTCEVRVSAVHGQLCLAMTTLRDVEQGEELTFDYCAVTESLNEYRAAVCLCGYRKCRGSFLHFATADCYQQVLSRNSPVAVRFANLIKGCMKKVMSREDEKVLANHGFGTAAFGAVGFNHHRQGNDPLDSIDYVPIWLRTFVADTLRYIEYERRALPIALLCNHLSMTDSSKMETSSKRGKEATKPPDAKKKATKISSTTKSSSNAKVENDSSENSKRIPGSKPMPVFLFFAWKQQDYFLSLLRDQGSSELKGAALKRAMQKIAGSSWKALGEDRKQYWKDEAVKEWEKNGGREKARLEEERKKRLRQAEASEDAKPGPNSKENGTVVDVSTVGHGVDVNTKLSKPKKKRKATNSNKNDFVCPSKISFEAADAEGIAAMEQRIQQLTQTLSRVGRVLDRHRESTFDAVDSLNRSSVSAAYLRSRIHSPVSILSDEHVVGWLWNHNTGVVKSLLHIVDTEKCVSPSLRNAVYDTAEKHDVLCAFQNPFDKSSSSNVCTISPAEARKLLKSLLLEFRSILLKELKVMDTDMKRHHRAKARKKNQARRERIRAKEGAMKPHFVAPVDKLEESGHMENEIITSIVRSVLSEVVDSVVSAKETGEPTVFSEECGCDSGPLDSDSNHVSSVVSDVLQGLVDVVVTRTGKPGKREESVKKISDSESDVPKLGMWMNHFDERGKLAAVADLLLLYAHTSTFFTLNPYLAFESSPIEVYARELGNAVPKSVMKNTTESISTSLDHGVLLAENTKDEPRQNLRPDATEMSRRDTDENDSHLSEKSIDISLSSYPDCEPQPKEVPTNSIASSRNCTSKASVTSNVSSSKSKLLNNEEGDGVKVLQEENKPLETDDFIPGARFGVLREGKEKRCTGIVVETDFDGDVKRVKFHFPKMLKKFDEWIEIGSSRICHLSHVGRKPLLPRKDLNKTGASKVEPSLTHLAKIMDSNFCEPDDVITNVIVKYHGDYVLSQLLQWYNGGIGQKPGMPDLIGCALLPPLSSCSSHPESNGAKFRGRVTKKYAKQTVYEIEIRKLLKEWFEDCSKRGSPWPEEIRSAFSLHSDDAAIDYPSKLAPFGSPVMDLLVTGDDSNIHEIVLEFMRQLNEGEADLSASSDYKRRGVESAAERLQSSVDEGRPAQAVANWVQCEDPGCMKWRKLPWHVDIDLLPEKFFCKDNIWNPNACNCDAPEDVWDEREDTELRTNVQEALSLPRNRKEKKPVPRKKETKSVREKKYISVSPSGTNKIDKSSFVKGARFDVLRKGYRGKMLWSQAVVVDTSFDGENLKVKFHFARRQAKFDQWVRGDSARIAPLSSQTRIEKMKGTDREKKGGGKEDAGFLSTQTEDQSSTGKPSATKSPPSAAGGGDNRGEQDIISAGRTQHCSPSISHCGDMHEALKCLEMSPFHPETGSTSFRPIAGGGDDMVKEDDGGATTCTEDSALLSSETALPAPSCAADDARGPTHTPKYPTFSATKRHFG